MAFVEVGWDDGDWIDLAQHRDQWRVGKFLSSCETGSFSRRAQLHGVSWLED
jgi:hypothetical protein